MPKVFTSKNQRIGELGETIACRFLDKNNYKILERNFFTASGEIDIIAEKSLVVYFIEVKSTQKNLSGVVSHETRSYNPADNMHKNKIGRLLKVVSGYKKEKNIKAESRILILLVFIDQINKLTKVETLTM